MRKIILVLDKKEYKKIEENIIKLFADRGYKVEIVYTQYEDSLIRRVRTWRLLGNFLQHILYWKKSLVYAIKIFFMRDSQEIISINPIVGIFLGLLNFKKSKSILYCGFLFEPKSNRLYYTLRKWVTYIFMRGIKKAVVYGKNEVRYYKNIFPGLNKFLFVPYGIDYFENQSYDKCKMPSKYIFSGGGSNRDYITLCKGYNIYRNNGELPLYIATFDKCLKGADTSNINVLQDVVLETFGDVMGNAMFLVLSLKSGEISAGHQVLFQALKENMIILVNRIPAVEDYVNEDQVIFYESGNAEDLSEKISFIINNYEAIRKKYENNNRYYYDNYTFIKLIDRLINVMEDKE